MKLYDLFNVISNKTVRPNEKKYKRIRSKSKNDPRLVFTNRGAFIDGYEVDQAAVKLWYAMYTEPAQA